MLSLLFTAVLFFFDNDGVLLKWNVSNWIKEILWCVSTFAGQLDYWSKLIVFFASPGVHIEESFTAIFSKKFGI